MSIATAPLPSDFAELRAFAASLQTEIAARDAELYAKTLHIEKLKRNWHCYAVRAFGAPLKNLTTTSRPGCDHGLLSVDDHDPVLVWVARLFAKDTLGLLSGDTEDRRLSDAVGIEVPTA